MSDPTGPTPPTDLQIVQADVEALKARMAAAELKVSTFAKTEIAKVESWFKANWPHIVTWMSTWGAAAVVVLKHI